jgi:tetratricopeptide (TPR) repeat protein
MRLTRSIMRTLHSLAFLTTLTFAATVLAGPNAPHASATEAMQQARAHYNLGTAHVEKKEYDDAIREFEAAYRLKPAPSFLYNIGVVARLGGHPATAVEAFQRYLATQPGKADRLEVEKMVADLQKQLAEEKEKERARQAAAAPPPAAATAPNPASASAPAPATAGESAAPNPLVEASAPAPAPDHKSRKKLWIALGVVGGALVVGGVVTGVVLSQRTKSDTIPSEYHDLGGISLRLGK